jgi:phosphonate transport system substrate-binding protein
MSVKRVATMRWLFGFIVFLFTLSASAVGSYRIGIVPQFSTMQTAKAWVPVLQQLEITTGYQFELVFYPDIPSFEKAFLVGDTDFVYLNPYHEVMAFDAQGYLPLVRDNKKLKGILVARKDSSIKKVEDLVNQKIAFPAPNAFGASLWMRAQLTRVFHIPFEAVYVGTHQNVYRQVAMGDVLAGGAVQATLDKESENLRQSLNVIYTTPEVAPHPFSVHPRISKAVATKVQQAILNMAITEENQKKLIAVQLDNPVVADYEQDYLPLKELNLQSFWQY